MAAPDVMGISEIAQRLGVSRKYAEQLVREKGAPDGTKLTMGWVYSTPDVLKWIAKRFPDRA